MNRLDQAFVEGAEQGAVRLLPFLPAGFPDVSTTMAILERLTPKGCTAVELGIPYSDPIADGPVIQDAFARALATGFRVEDLWSALREARPRLAVPLIAMVSYSIVFRRGPERFVEEALMAGIDGLIVPDLSIEESPVLHEICQQRGCALTMIAAPTSTARRRETIARISSPFIYYQSIAGITGERSALPPDLVQNVESLRQLGGKPVCVGFGIAKPEHVRDVCRVADGAIVGSAIVRRMIAATDRGVPHAALVDEIVAFIEELGAG